MKTLEQQLGIYGEIVGEAQRPVSIDDVVIAGGDTPLLISAGNSQRRWVWAVGAAVIVFVLGGIPLILRTPQPPAATQPPPATADLDPAATAQPTTPAEIPGLLRELARVETPDWMPSRGMLELGLAATGEEFVLCEESGEFARRSWYATSTDGANWDRFDIPSDRARFSCEQVLGGIAAWVTGDPGDPDSGYEPEEVEVRNQAGQIVNHDFNSEVFSVAVSSDMVVAMVADSGIWFSEEGSGWQKAVNAPDSVLQIIGTRDGFYLIENTGGVQDPLEAWFSSDGAEWAQIGTAMGGWGELQRWGSSAVWTGDFRFRSYYLLTPDGVTESEALPTPASDPYTTGAVEVDGQWATGSHAGELVVSTNGPEGRISAIEFIPTGQDRRSVSTDTDLEDEWFVAAAAVEDTYLLITRDDDGAVTFWRGDAS